MSGVIFEGAATATDFGFTTKDEKGTVKPHSEPDRKGGSSAVSRVDPIRIARRMSGVIFEGAATATDFGFTTKDEKGTVKPHSEPDRKGGSSAVSRVDPIRIARRMSGVIFEGAATATDFGFTTKDEKGP